MKDGKVHQIGSPLYLYNHPINKFVAGFIGSPPMNFLSVTVIEDNGAIKVDEGSFILEPTEEHQKHLKRYVGKQVFFGIRPEDMELSQKASEKNAMQLKITVKEPLGAETHLYLASKGQQLIARTFEAVEGGIGDTLIFIPNMEKAKYFDFETEKTICEDVKSE
ncbi:TOBE domain protein [Treponema phagedenis F0421]|nr:TOBE domain protein [Treponema phagedenis F0421]